MPQNRVEDSAEHIFGNGTGDDILNRFLNRLTEWRHLNPNTEINLWFDSVLVTERAYLNTVDKFSHLDIQLRDIRTIPNMSTYIELSLHPLTQLYYRVDMAKILIADYLIEYGDKQYVIVSDIDVKVMNSKQTFDLITVRWLDEYGYVFTNSGLSLFENSFFIFDSEHPSAGDIHREYMIDRVAEELANMPKDMRYEVDTVFDKYPAFTTAMGERRLDDRPRKPVDVPESQFAFGGSFERTDLQSEQFRFSPNSTVSIIRYGPREDMYWLEDWYPEPLVL